MAVQTSTWRVPWQVLLAEAAGTALLLLGGLSGVVLLFGTGSPLVWAIPSEGARRVIGGFLFGSTGASVAISPLGKESGAHLNPVVTLGFWVMRTMDTRLALCYVVAQFAGALAGTLPLLAWGEMGRSVAFGATVPGDGYRIGAVFLGEVITTFMLITGLSICLGFRRLRPFTPALFPFLYAVMVYLEAPISGTSTNPARSFGPAVVSGVWQGWWIYVLGPLAGTALALIACIALKDRIEVAKTYHFEHERRHLLRRHPV